MKNKNKIRTQLRRLLNKNIYNKLASSLNKIETIRCQGFRVYKDLYDQNANNVKTKSVKFRKVQFPIYFRPKTIDVETIVQSLIRKEYDKGIIGNNPTNIIDAGCYIGDVSIFYLNKFSNSKVIALEPNEANYEIAKLNLAPYKDRAVLYKKGLWSSKTFLSFEGDFTSGSLISNNDKNKKIECIDINSLLIENKLDRIDLLKLDIEGAEQEVILNNSENWLPKTKLISVEFHGVDIKEQCLKKLNDFGFEGFEYRSIYHLYNRSTI